MINLYARELKYHLRNSGDLYTYRDILDGIGRIIIIISTSKSREPMVDFSDAAVKISKNCETGKLFNKTVVRVGGEVNNVPPC